jgi:hypothetical protein
VFAFGAGLVALWGISAAGMRVPQRAQMRGAGKVGVRTLGDEAAR